MALKPRKERGGLQIENEQSLDLFENESNGSNKVSLKAPASLAADNEYTLPDALPSAPAVLQSDDSGTLSWETDISGGGGINHIENSDFETDTAGYATYADAAGTSPVDGNGGSATTSFTRITSGQLRGIASGRITKDAADRQGEGVRYAFTTEESDKLNIQRISFDVKTSANYEDGDMRVYIYDVTNSEVIEPSRTEIDANENAYNFVTEFQCTDSTSYRLIFHVASTNAAAYTVDIDNVQVGPRLITRGTVVTDWKEFTPSVSNFTASSSEAYYRRVGDSLEVTGRLIYSSGTGVFQLTLPNGLSADPTKIDFNTGTATQTLGTAFASDFTPGNNYSGNVCNGTAINTVAFRGPTAGLWGNTTPFTFASGDDLSFSFSVPIQGWESNLAISEDFGGRIVTATADIGGTNVNLAPNSSSVKIPFDNALIDTTGSFDTSLNRYVLPSSGYYEFSTFINISSTNVLNNDYFLDLHKNGSFFRRLDLKTAATSERLPLGGSYTDQGVKGDYYEIFLLGVGDNSVNQLTTTAQGDGNYFCIKKVQGPQTLSGGEVVACSYSSDAGQSVILSNAVTYEDKLFDTHNAYNTSTGVFTAPVAGKYKVNLAFGTAAVSATIGNLIAVNVSDGTNTRSLGYVVAQSTSSIQYFGNGTAFFDLNAGETLSFTWNETFPPGTALVSSAQANFLNIEKL